MSDSHPDTTADPRPAAEVIALDWVSERVGTMGPAVNLRLVRDLVGRLADAGLLSLSGDSTQGQGAVDMDEVRLPTYTVLRADLIGKVGGRISGLTGAPALESPTREITHQIADAVLPVNYVAQLNAERGRLYRAADGQAP